MSIDTSTDIERYIREEPIRDASDGNLRETFTPGTFGESAEPQKLQAMSLRRHYLFEAETKLEQARTLFERIDEQGLSDNLGEVIEQVWARLADGSEEGSAA